MSYSTLGLDELARHIGMDAREVRRLAERGVIPGQLVGGQWRFHRAALLDWLQRDMHTLHENDRRNLERAVADVPDALLLAQLIPRTGIELNLPARSRASVLRELVRLVDRTGLLYDAEGMLAALEEREALGPTALPGGLAIPHPRRPLPYATAEPLVCVARVPAGIGFSAGDGRLTDLFVLICSHDDRSHLHALARVSLTFSPELCAALRAATDADEALKLIADAEQRMLRERRS